MAQERCFSNREAGGGGGAGGRVSMGRSGRERLGSIILSRSLALNVEVMWGLWGLGRGLLKVYKTTEHFSSSWAFIHKQSDRGS